MVKKLMIIGCIFVVLVILLIPSYSAIQFRTFENLMQNELTEQKGILNFKEFKEKINLANISKHSILFSIVNAIFTLRLLRTMILFELSTEVDWIGEQPVYEIIHPLLYQRAKWLGITAWIWVELWFYISQYLGWDWFN